MNHSTNVILAQADSFQADIFPPAPSNEPSVSASEYFNGKNPTLKLISLENGSPAAAPPPSSSSYSAAPPTPSSAAPAPPPIQATRSYSASAPAPAAAPPPAAASFSEPIPTPTSAVPRSAAVSSPVETRTPIRSQTSDSKVCLRNESSFNVVLIFFLRFKQTELESENARLESELREAREKIRNLELQVETFRANARKAQALLSQ